MEDKFFSKWNGRFVDYDHAFGNQCVDLIRQFVLERMGVNAYTAIPSTGSAKSIFKNFRNNKYYTKILNGPYNVPKKGDIIFFGTYPFLYGWAGHTAVIESANVNSMITFDQNYPTKSPCHFVKHNYKGCLGWLTPTV